jgi:hypothetical protein
LQKSRAEVKYFRKPGCFRYGSELWNAYQNSRYSAGIYLLFQPPISGGGAVRLNFSVLYAPKLNLGLFYFINTIL